MVFKEGSTVCQIAKPPSVVVISVFRGEKKGGEKIKIMIVILLFHINITKAK